MKRWMLAALCLGLLTLAACKSGGGKTAQGTSLRFRSFDGGGPSYSCELEDPSLVSVTSERQYDKANHEELTGAGYDVVFTFTGLKPGETVLTVSGDSPIAPEPDMRYAVTVDETLQVTLTPLPELDPAFLPPNSAVLVLETEEYDYSGVLADGPAAEALVEMLWSDAMELELHRTLFGLEGQLPEPLPMRSERLEAKAGWLVLSDGTDLLLCAKPTLIEGELLADFGERFPTSEGEEPFSVLLWLQWSE